MDQTAGNRLRQARLSKKLDVDQVSEATKIRPERIIDLERDDYTQFPNLAYARGFLFKYAQYLGVNVDQELEHFRINPSVSLSEYQYLNSNAPKFAFDARSPVVARELKVPTWIVVTLVLIVLVGIPAIGFWTFNVSRLAKTGIAAPNSQTSTSDQPASASESASLVSTVKVTEDLLANATPTRASSGQPSASASPPKPFATPSMSSSLTTAVTAASQSAFQSQAPEVRRALPVSPASQAPSPQGVQDRKLEVHARHQTWIKVIRDKEHSTPVFDGFTGPADQPIVIQGKRFWLKVTNHEAVDVFENGRPIQSSSNDIVIY
jgi:cytoskeletal protein RodZ